jgi:hypothetical protein
MSFAYLQIREGLKVGIVLAAEPTVFFWLSQLLAGDLYQAA